MIDDQILSEEQLQEIEIKYGFPFHTNPSFGLHVRRLITSNRKLIEERTPIARHIDEWGEEDGDVLWWRFPIDEPPYCGTPLDSNWPDYHTHWTPLILPKATESTEQHSEVEAE